MFIAIWKVDWAALVQAVGRSKNQLALVLLEPKNQKMTAIFSLLLVLI